MAATYRKRELSLPGVPVLKRKLSLPDLPVFKRELSLPDLPVFKRELSLPDLSVFKRELSLPDLPVFKRELSLPDLPVLKTCLGGHPPKETAARPKKELEGLPDCPAGAIWTHLGRVDPARDPPVHPLVKCPQLKRQDVDIYVSKLLLF